MLEHGPNGLFDLTYWRVGRIIVMGKVEMTGFAAQAAMDAGFQIGFKAGASFIFQNIVDSVLDLFRGQPGETGFNALVHNLRGLF